MLKNYYILNYHGPFIRENLKVQPPKNYVKNLEYAWTVINPLLPTVITTEAFDFIKTLNIKPRMQTRIFIGDPKAKSVIHDDTSYDTYINKKPIQSYALNYMFSDSHSTMRWFYPARFNAGKSRITDADSPYIMYDPGQVKVSEELTFPKNKLVLVRIDVPHQVVNHSHSIRHCISIRGNLILNWADAVEYFRPYILEES
jgi:hypothetical protein